MAGRSTRRRSGFTLVEMLVVIAIIAILAGILIPVGATALARARRTSNGLEIADITQAINKYRSENGGLYPPSFGEAQAMSPPTTYSALYANGTGPWRNTLLGRYINKAYPKCSQRDIAYMFQQVADNMDQCSALPFWLNQTSADARYPFTGITKRSYMSMEEQRLERGAFIAGTPAPAANPAIPDLQLYGFHPRHAGQSLYIYIEARHYPQHVRVETNSASPPIPPFHGLELQHNAGNTRPAAGTGTPRLPEFSVRPWIRQNPTNFDPTDLTNYMNPDSFQLHMAGLDGRFCVNYDWIRKWPCGPTGLRFDGSQQDPDEFMDDRDNQTSFSDGNAVTEASAQP